MIMNIHKERMKGKINMKEKNSIAKGTMKIFAVVIFGLGLAFGVGPAARTTLVGGTLQAMATADVHDANLLITQLGGVITADEVKAVSTTTHDATGFHTSAEGSTFVNLVVAGIPIMGTPPPNTQINLV